MGTYGGCLKNNKKFYGWMSTCGAAGVSNIYEKGRNLSVCVRQPSHLQIEATTHTQTHTHSVNFITYRTLDVRRICDHKDSRGEHGRAQISR